MRRRKQAAPERASAALPEPSVGDRIEIYWAGDKRYYAGKVAEYKGPHVVQIAYDDGDIEDISLLKERWRYPRNAGGTPGGPATAGSGSSASASTGAGVNAGGQVAQPQVPPPAPQPPTLPELPDADAVVEPEAEPVPQPQALAFPNGVVAAAHIAGQGIKRTLNREASPTGSPPTQAEKRPRNMAILAEMTHAATRSIVQPMRDEQAAIIARLTRTDDALEGLLVTIKNYFEAQRRETRALGQRLERIENLLRRGLAGAPRQQARQIAPAPMPVPVPAQPAPMLIDAPARRAIELVQQQRALRRTPPSAGQRRPNEANEITPASTAAATTNTVAGSVQKPQPKMKPTPLKLPLVPERRSAPNGSGANANRRKPPTPTQSKSPFPESSAMMSQSKQTGVVVVRRPPKPKPAPTASPMDVTSSTVQANSLVNTNAALAVGATALNKSPTNMVNSSTANKNDNSANKQFLVVNRDKIPPWDGANPTQWQTHFAQIPELTTTKSKTSQSGDHPTATASSAQAVEQNGNGNGNASTTNTPCSWDDVDEVIGRFATKWLLEDPTRAPPPPGKQQVKNWAVGCTDQCFAHVVQQLMAYPSINAARNFLTANLGSPSYKWKWLVQTNENQLRLARSNYQAWAPPISDQEWPAEKAVLNEIAQRYQRHRSIIQPPACNEKIAKALAIARASARNTVI